MRDVRDHRVRDKAHFDARYEYEVAYAAKRLKVAEEEKDQEVVARILSGVFDRKTRILNIRYSRGDDLDAIRADLPEVIETFLRAEEVGLAVGDGHMYRPDVLHEEELDLLAFCYCLGVEEDLLQRYLACFVPEGKSTLTDRLVAVHQPGRKIGDPKRWRLASRYRYLNEAIDAPPEQVPKLVKKHLRHYEKELADYKKPLEENTAYGGYWAYDLAAVVKAFGLDDSGFADNAFYPYDLVHYRD